MNNSGDYRSNVSPQDYGIGPSEGENQIHEMPKPSKFAPEIAVQTDTHPVESFIDPKYQFSQWQLRKNVVRAADLRDKKDNKTQTIQSHFRRENETQVYLKKYVLHFLIKLMKLSFEIGRRIHRQERKVVPTQLNTLATFRDSEEIRKQKCQS